MHDQHGATVAQPHERDDDALTFDVAPVSLWLHDYSAVKALFADWKTAGVADLREFLREILIASRHVPSGSASSRSTGGR